MRLPRPRFTLQWLMIATAIAGIGLAAIAITLRERERARRKAAYLERFHYAAEFFKARDWVRLDRVPVIPLKPVIVTSGEDEHIRSLIASLAEFDDPNFGQLGEVRDRPFLPIEARTSRYGPACAEPPIAFNSASFRELVKLGPRSLPLLLASLGDKTPTRLLLGGSSNEPARSAKPERRWWLNTSLSFDRSPFYVLHGNPLNSLERDAFDRLLASDEINGPKVDLPEYRVRIGDVCFVAIGQIVGRRYEIVGWEDKFSTVVESTAESELLRETARSIWSSPDTRRMLLDSLLRDYHTQGIFNGSSLDGWDWGNDLQVEAAARLLYYYPKETAPMIAQRLRRMQVHSVGPSRGSRHTPAELDAYMKREVANGVRTNEFIEAIAWCNEPAIREALDEIKARTEDVDILETLQSPPKQSAK